jgi:hypothetical protein
MTSMPLVDSPDLLRTTCPLPLRHYYPFLYINDGEIAMSSSILATPCYEGPSISSSSPCSSRSSDTKAVLESTGTRSSFRSRVPFPRSAPRPTRGPGSRSGEPSTASRGRVLEMPTGSSLPTIPASAPWSGPRWAAPFPSWPWEVPAARFGAQARATAACDAATQPPAGMPGPRPERHSASAAGEGQLSSRNRSRNRSRSRSRSCCCSCWSSSRHCFLCSQLPLELLLVLVLLLLLPLQLQVPLLLLLLRRRRLLLLHLQPPVQKGLSYSLGGVLLPILTACS